ncbi:hypothetical protein SY2F82_09650 [Streptomyces sp. Y2F8-2]|nr:hypothetical protein SY2F82_09650 [Streptomyces sp. Y2F8-2]
MLALPDGELVGRDAGRVDVVAVRVVPGVLGDAAGVEGEEVGHRLVLDVHADGVDQDEAADDPGGVAHGHLRGDPAAERRSDDEDVVQRPVAQQVQIGEGQVVDAGEPAGAVGAVPTGVHGREGVRHPGEALGEARDRGRPSAAVQDQDRPAVAGFRQGEGQAVVNDRCGVRLHARHTN